MQMVPTSALELDVDFDSDQFHPPIAKLHQASQLPYQLLPVFAITSNVLKPMKVTTGHWNVPNEKWR